MQWRTAEQFEVSPLTSGLTPWGHNKKRTNANSLFDPSMKMIDLLSSVNDFCIVFGNCFHLGRIHEIHLESRHNSASVVFTPRVPENVSQSPLYAADKFSSCTPMEERNLLARASSFEKNLVRRQRKIDGRGEPPAFSESTNKKASCRKSE